MIGIFRNIIWHTSPYFKCTSSYLPLMLITATSGFNIIIHAHVSFYYQKVSNSVPLYIFGYHKNRVGGWPLTDQPTSHTTVRTDRYTAVQSYRVQGLVRFGYVVISAACKSFVCNGVGQNPTTRNSPIAFSRVSVSVCHPVGHSQFFEIGYPRSRQLPLLPDIHSYPSA